MDTICPKCGVANSSEAKICHCGYDLPSKPTRNGFSTTDFQDSNSPIPLVDPGEAQTIRTLRLVAGLSIGVLVGILLLVWELSSSSITAWGIIHPILVIVCCAGLLIAGKRGWFS
jgi:hypothetical protein